MTRRKGDETASPPGGRAAERRREFEEARSIPKREQGAETPQDKADVPPDSQQPTDNSSEKKSRE
jgi:hypothetical protein